MSTLLYTIDPEGDNISALSATVQDGAKALQYFPSNDIHRQQATPHRASCTNIYKTKDQRFFHLHGIFNPLVSASYRTDIAEGSMNPDPSLESVGLPKEMDARSLEEAWKPYIDAVSSKDSQEMQHLASEVHRQAGTICWTTEEYKASKHGKANAHVGLWEVREHANPGQPATWWQDAPHTCAQRPLGGLKIVDLTRVIAAPSITRGLAELGASVMRVTAPHLVDFSGLHCDLNWGKWNSHLDFRKPEDREKIRALILEADVVVTGYRPQVLDKWQLGEEDILELCKDRKGGIVYVRENCYGWHGPWAHRSGWQQISDAVSRHHESQQHRRG